MEAGLFNPADPLRNKWRLREYGLEFLLAVIISTTALSLVAPMPFWDAAGESIGVCMVAAVISVCIRAPTQILHYTLRRLNLSRRHGFHPWRSIRIVAIWWLAWFILVMICPLALSKIVTGQAHDSSFTFLWGLAIVMFSAPFYAASLLAPLLVYRLTGYLFDADFSQPPWSQGKWGFGKPTAVPVEPQPE